MSVRSFPILLALLVAPALACGDSPTPERIFDGGSFEGWEGKTDSWRIESGTIVGEIADGERLERNQFLFWDGVVHDFELSLQFRISGDPKANSGIQYRAQKLPDGGAKGYQADLDSGKVWLGRIYDEHGRKLIAERGTRVAIAPDGRRWIDEFARADSFEGLLKPDDWNTYQITAVASHVEVRVNGTLCSVLDDREIGESEFSGRLGLQLHSGQGPAKVEFREIMLTDLGKTALPPGEKAVSLQLSPALSIAPTNDRRGQLNLSFETGTLDDWTVEGEAWKSQPASFHEPATPRRKADVPTTPVGTYWIGGNATFRDRGTGQLTSAPFEVTQPWASYMIGGGKNIDRTRIEIVEADNGEVLQQAAGEDSDELRRELIDLQSALGKKIFIRLVDESAELNGRISFDDFVFHDRKPTLTSKNVATYRLHESPVLWHLQPNPAEPTEVENPEAQALVREMSVTDGFRAELIAAEPEVHQPIAFTFDDRGRIWVVEAYSYPNKRLEGKGEDRIVIFEDADGNGSFETRSVFTEGLNLVSGLEVGFGGVWVGAAPELLFIPDADQDDVPDGPPEVLLDGWGYQDTHETLNSFTWGPDGWLYGVQGVFTRSFIGKPGASSNQRMALNAGIWRYHPQQHRFEIFARGGSNQWGLDFNEVGDLFMTHCRSRNGGGGTSYVVRNGRFWNQANRGYADFVSRSAPDFAPDLRNYLLASARYGHGEGGAGKPGSNAVYGGHSHVGTMIYLGDNWPDAYRGHVFTHNLHGQQINHQHNVQQGSGYETYHAGYDLLFSPDPTYLPVDLKYGPDGAVYSIDWSDHQHCHSPVNEAWERTNGRIYRISWTDTWEPKQVDLGSLDDVELAELHSHRNEWYVRTARRILQERAISESILPQAVAMLRQQATQPGDVSARLRALWTLYVTDSLDTDAIGRISHDSAPEIRAWAIRFATQGRGEAQLSDTRLKQMAAEDPSPIVRLALASAASTLPGELCWKIAEALALWSEDADDPFLPKMVWFAVAPLVEDDIVRALELAQQSTIPTLTDSIHWYLARSSEGREALVNHLVSGQQNIDAERAVRVAAFSLEEETSLKMPSSWTATRQSLETASISPETEDALAKLSALFGDESVLAATRSKLADERSDTVQRREALDLLKRVGDLESTSIYIDLLENEDLRSEAIPLLANTDDSKASTRLIELFEELDFTDKAAALSVLTSRPTHALALLDAAQDGQLARKHLNSLHLRQMRALEDDRVDARLDEVWGKLEAASKDAQAEIQRLATVSEEYPMWSLNADNGRTTFLQSCAACHRIDGEGGAIGPDLSGSWRNGTEYFLENIIAPNAVVGANYQLHIITMDDGAAVAGMIEAENERTLTVRTTAEEVVVRKRDIAKRQTLDESMMPAGLLDSMTEIEVLELLKYLTNPR